MTVLKKWFFNIVVLAGGILVTLFVVEIGVRLFAVHRVYEFPEGLYIPDELLGYRMAPNFEGRHLSANYEWDVVIKTNSDGFWDYEHGPKHGPRILGVGDSFTFPFGVGFKKGYLGVLEDELGVEVVKTGVSGYNPIQYRDFIKERGVSYEPELVVLGFYVGNDIHANYSPKTDITAKDGVLVQAQQTGQSSKSGFLRHFFKTVPWFLRQHYRTYSFVMDRIKSSPVLRNYVNLLAEDMRKLHVPELAFMKKDHSDTYIQATWDATEGILTEIHHFLEARDIALMVVIIPTDYQVYEDKWQRVAKQYELDPQAYDMSLPNEKMKEICQLNGIAVLDLLPKSKTLVTSGVNLYFKYNRHWAVAGNRMAGKEIAAFIRQNHLLDTTMKK